MLDPQEAGGWLVALIMGGAATYERFRSAREAKKREINAEAISDARKHADRADVMAKLAEEYKALFEREHRELNTYRDEVHAKAKADQAVLIKKEERIVELQARPDFSDLFEHLKTQSDVSVRILGGIEGMVSMMKTLLERGDITHQNRA